LKLVTTLAPVPLVALTVAAQTGPVALQSPDGAIEISIATARVRSMEAAGGQPACRVEFYD
jgi:hypothetical protein